MIIRNVALLLATLLFGLFARSNAARADVALDVAKELRGFKFGSQLLVLEDARGALDIDAVRALPDDAFRKGSSDAPNFGYTSSVYWLRFTVQNSGDSQRVWLLEVAYPLLDRVTLFAPRANGELETRETGDMVPFSQRDIPFRNFVFELKQSAHSQQTYYLRAQSTGAMTLPLVAWTMRQFVEHQHLDWSALCVFYGVLLVMACYNACLFMFTRAPEYAFSAISAACIGLFQFTYAGHTFQFLFPNDPAVVHAIMPLSVGFAFSSTVNISVIVGRNSASWLSRRVLTPIAIFSLVATLVTPFMSYNASIRLILVVCALGNIIAVVCHVSLLLKGVQEAKLFFAAWATMIGMTLITVLRSVGVLPEFWLTIWSLQIGTAFGFVMLSSGLAQKINIMRADLTKLNLELSHKVNALETALSQAAEATLRAQGAARVKGEFLATMTHELRTPLNAIINIPQGLLEQFPVAHYASCSHCNSDFELEPNETVAPSSACPECQQTDTLQVREMASYVGAPEHTTRYLGKIVRSGKHLLQIVNDILEVGKTDQSYLRISPERIELTALARGVVDEMSDLAEHSRVGLQLVSSLDEAYLSADPLRLRQVLINLVGNAIKFSDGRGQVTVRLEQRGDCYQFSVSDQGVGIAKKDLEGIFRSYEQTERQSARRFGGTGLGLSVARSLVRMHGGELWVESQPGKGSTFSFKLPRVGIKKTPESGVTALAS